MTDKIALALELAFKFRMEVGGNDTTLKTTLEDAQTILDWYKDREEQPARRQPLQLDVDRLKNAPPQQKPQSGFFRPITMASGHNPGSK